MKNQRKKYLNASFMIILFMACVSIVIFMIKQSVDVEQKNAEKNYDFLAEYFSENPNGNFAAVSDGRVYAYTLNGRISYGVLPDDIDKDIHIAQITRTHMYLLSVQKSKVTVYKTDLAFKSVDEVYSYESRDSMTVDFFDTDKMYHSIDDKYYICDLLTGEAEEVAKDAHVSEVKYESDIPSVLGGKKITLLETESEKTVVLNTSDVIIRVATECDVAKYLIDNDKLIFWDIEISDDDIYFIFCASGCEAIYKYDFENDAFTLHTVLYNDYLLGVGGEYYSFE